MNRGKHSLKYGRGLVGVLGAVTALTLLVSPPVHAQRVVPLTSESGEEMMPELAGAPAPEFINVALHKAHLITLSEPIRDVIVAYPDIADVIVKTPRQIYLLGQNTGETNTFFVGLNGNVVRHIVVEVEADLVAARQALADLMPDANISLRNVNSNVVMSGTVRSAVESVNAFDVVSRFVEYEDDDGELRVINMLRITEDQQVLLQVRVGEIQRSTLKTLGFDTGYRELFDNGTKGIVGVAAGAANVTNSIATGTFLLNEFGLGLADFSTLEQQGLVKTLAEPVLTAISGETATFLAGGEFPVPSGISQSGSLAFEFKPFGVSLGFTPVVLSGGQISLRVGVEVSATTTVNQITINTGTQSATIPGINVRRTESTVTVPSGGTVMIAGLVSNAELNTLSGVPGIMNLPVIGALFRSHSFQKNETQLVVLITAFRVRSIDSRGLPSLPTDGFVTAGDADIYLYGRLHKRYGDIDELVEPPSVYGPIGYLME